MKRIWFVVLFSWLLILQERSHATECTTRIDLLVSIEYLANSNIRRSFPEFYYEIALRKDDIHNDSFFRKTEYGHISGRIFDCRGALRIHVYDTVKGVEIRGQYVNCPDTLKRLIMIEDLEKGDGEIKVDQYFSPLKDGEWLFIDKKRNVVEKVVFKKDWEKQW